MMIHCVLPITTSASFVLSCSADLRVLIYMTELEEANFKVPSSVLRQHDKTSVARSVIASSARQRNPVALRVAAEMCREFGSVPTDVWIVLLQQLVSLQEVSD